MHLDKNLHEWNTNASAMSEEYYYRLLSVNRICSPWFREDLSDKWPWAHNPYSLWHFLRVQRIWTAPFLHSNLSGWPLENVATPLQILKINRSSCRSRIISIWFVKSQEVVKRLGSEPISSGENFTNRCRKYQLKAKISYLHGILANLIEVWNRLLASEQLSTTKMFNDVWQFKDNFCLKKSIWSFFAAKQMRSFFGVHNGSDWFCQALENN